MLSSPLEKCGEQKFGVVEPSRATLRLTPWGGDAAEMVVGPVVAVGLAVAVTVEPGVNDVNSRSKRDR